MDLSYGPEYEVFRDEVKQFIEENRHQAPRDMEPSQGMLTWQALLVKNGYTARTIPEEYGGYGAEPDILKSRIIAEEFARAQVPGGLVGQGPDMLVPTLLELGTEEQKTRFIPPTLLGEMLWCEGYSEPNAGSDLASLTTSAELDGDEWVVNGQKIWTSSAKTADWIFCLVRTEPEASKHKGISFLLFSMDTPGIDPRPIKSMAGDTKFNEVFFKDVRVPKDQIVGKRGEGWAVANTLLQHERGGLGDPKATLTRLNSLMDLMKNETLNGSRVIDNPVFRDRLMKIQGRVLALHYNGLRLLSAKINRQRATLAGALVKLQGTELRHDLEGLGIDVMGELGVLFEDSPYIRDFGSWQVTYMYFLGLIIGGGTSQIQKNIISERVLGMPRAPKPK